MKLIGTLLATALAAAACAGGGTGPSITPAASPTTQAPTLAPVTAAPVPSLTAQPTETLELPDLSGEVPAELLLSMLQQVSEATGVALPELVVEEAQAVTWSDGSIGCPEPGMMYTQALVDGYRVVIRAAAETYDFHASQTGHFVLCPPERSRPPIEP